MKRSSSPKIAFVTSTYARHQDDPQVPWMREQVSRLKARGLDIEIFAPSFEGRSSHKIDGVQVNRFRYSFKSLENITHDEGAPNKKRTLAFKFVVLSYLFFGTLATFWWCLRKRVTVLHVHWPFPHALWAVLPKRILGVRVLVMNHGSELALARKNERIRKVLTFLIKQADACCANTSHTAAEVKKISGRDSLITPCGATVQAIDTELQPRKAFPVLLVCGRLIQRKGIDVLLRALPTVLREQEIRLVITGEGNRKAEWEALSQNLGLEKQVSFPGFLSEEELAELYQTSDLYIHPAIFDDNGDTEGLAVVLVEALAHKLPVIASAVGGIVDVIKDETTGLLVEEKNESALAKAILRVLNDDELANQLGTNGFHHVQNFFDWDRITQQTEKIYQNMLDPGAVPATRKPNSLSSKA